MHLQSRSSVIKKDTLTLHVCVVNLMPDPYC